MSMKLEPILQGPTIWLIATIVVFLLAAVGAVTVMRWLISL
jgi:hypothetical protein